MTKLNEAAVCGLYCGACEYRDDNPCRGCMAVEGQPAWVKQLDIEACPLYSCCVTDRQLEHCGMCEKLPCDLFLDSHDPSLSPEEGKEDIENRIKSLRIRKDIGTDKWLQQQRESTSST